MGCRKADGDHGRLGVDESQKAAPRDYRPLPVTRCAQLVGRKPTLEGHDDLDHGEWIGPEAEKAETSGMTPGNADMVGLSERELGRKAQ